MYNIFNIYSELILLYCIILYNKIIIYVYIIIYFIYFNKVFAREIIINVNKIVSRYYYSMYVFI